MNDFVILVLLSVSYVISGACYAIFNKYIVSQESLGLKFSHGWFINLVMFIWESMGIPVFYLLFNKKQPKEKIKDIEESLEKKEEEKPEINKFLLAIPGFLDTCSTGLANIGLILLPASIYQMLKGSVIVMTFLLSKFVIKNKHTLDHYVAIPISTIGLVLVGLSAYLNADETSEDEDNIADAKTILLGIVLILVAMFFLSIQFCIDEYFMRKYSCHPLICIGYEGIFGFLINLFLCIIFYFIKCGSYEEKEEPPYFVKNMCTSDNANVWRPENIFFAFRQLFNNGLLCILVPINLIFMGSFNIFGVSITKYGSATTRTVTDNCRSFLVWIWFLMPFNQENLIETFNFMQLIGFLLICFGAFVYNGLFKLDERRKGKDDLIDDKIINDIAEETIIDSERPTGTED